MLITNRAFYLLNHSQVYSDNWRNQPVGRPEHALKSASPAELHHA